MSASACLVTSQPTLEEPVPTKPFLEVEGADPDPRQILVIDTADDAFTVTLSANVRSEDAESAVQVRALLDYGTCFLNGAPFTASFSGNDVGAGSIDDPVRKATVNATFGAVVLQPGCHRLTLMASHDFDEGTGCPSDADDFTQITWTVFRCNSMVSGDCDGFDPDTCPPVQASCTNFQACQVPP
jgi:hypothetical protein